MVEIMPIDKDVPSHHFLSNPPKVCERVSQGGGDGEGAEEDVGDSEVDQEDVARCPHHLSHHINLMHLSFNIIQSCQIIFEKTLLLMNGRRMAMLARRPTL